MKIIVLGGCGRQGTVVTSDLIKKGFDVDVADAAPRKSDSNKVSVIDLSIAQSYKDILSEYDLAVGTLPAKLGKVALESAVEMGINYVDLSFMEEDPSYLHEQAVKNGCTVLHDCGVAPGLSHLVVGRALHMGADEIDICVGGVAKDSAENYVITWSPEDLYDEYTRPARIIIDGEVRRVPALSCERSEYISELRNVGNLRSFYTDGLRSLLKKNGQVNRMTERTMRWLGHIEQVGELLYKGQDGFSDGMRKLYRECNDDILAMSIIANRSGGGGMPCIVGHVDLIQYGDSEMSAMARTTALSCSAFSQLIATKTFDEPGVIAPEDIATNTQAYKFIFDCLAENGVGFDWKYPFIW